MKEDQLNSQSQSSSNLDRYDTVLLIVTAVSMVMGIVIPKFGMVFEPFLLVFLGLLLFLNLIKMNPQKLLSRFKKPIPLIILTLIKLLVIPIFLFIITSVTYPSLAIPVLLLSGISTGLGAPFVINVFEKSNRLPLVVGMVIFSSIAVPFILPSLVYSLAKVDHFKVPLEDMVILLSEALFLPLLAGWIVKNKIPKIAKKIERNSFLPSVILIALMNLGMFAKFSEYFISEISFVIVMFIAAFSLFFTYGLIGYLAGYLLEKKDKSFRIAAFVSMSYVNNVLVVVFASQFFGTEVAALAVFYNLAYYGLIIPMKKIFFIKS